MSIKDLSLEELLQIAQSDGQSNKIEIKTDVNNYIKHFSIKSGTDRTPAYIIYYHYRKWRRQNYMHRSDFFKAFKLIFEKVKDQPIYMLDNSTFDTSLEGSIKARVFLRKDRDAKRKKKEKSKS